MTFDAEQLWSIPRVGRPSCDVRGEVVVVPVTTHDDGPPLTRLWLVDGREIRPLTSVVASSSAPVVSPDGTRLAFVRKVDDQPQLHVLRLDGGEAVAVTDLPMGVAGSATWCPDGRLVVVAPVFIGDPTVVGTRSYLEDKEEREHTAHVTELREYRFWHTWLTEPVTHHLFLVDPDDGNAPVDLTPEAVQRLGWGALDDPGDLVAVSTDGATVAWTARTIADDELQQLWVRSLDGDDEPRSLTPDTDVHVSSPVALPDGRIVIRVPTARSPYSAPADLVAYDLGGGRAVLLDAVAWDRQPSSHELRSDGLLVVGSEHHGRSVVALIDPSDGSITDLPIDRSLATPVAAGDAVLAVRSGIDLPPDLVRVTADGVTVLTTFGSDALAGVDLGRVEERWMPGAEGRDNQVFLLHPPTDAGPSTPPSLVHLVHGGPHGIFGDVWHWRWSAATIAARGHLVAMVNFHGSTSYGHDVMHAIHGDWATLPTQDVEAVTDALVDAGEVDPGRMAITGGSYGGYLTTWITGTTDRYACAIAHAAVTDHGGMYASDITDNLDQAQGGKVWEDLDAVLATSPAAHYAGHATPTLVIHGQQDHRVPIDQGLALYGVLKAKGVTARLVHYPDEHHWVLQKANSLHWYGEFLDWLDRFI